MKIAVEATCWHNRRGYGRHARALLKALVAIDQANAYTFFLDSDEGVGSLPEKAALRLVQAGTPAARAASADGRRSLADLLRMSQALSTPGYDQLIYPSVYSFTPALSKARKIVFIHDVIAEKYPQLTTPRRSARLLWQAKVALGLRQADAIVTVSNYSRGEILQHFRLPEERVFVVGEASDPTFRPLADPALTGCLQTLGIPDQGRLLVYVGGFGPHKNLAALLSAFEDLAQDPQLEDVTLVLVGEYKQEIFHSVFETLRSQAAHAGLDRRVIFTGFLPDEELVVLLNRAAVLALPSLMEGFGLPAVEAAACGCPVVATRNSPLPELLGEGGIYIDPLNQAELGEALGQVLRSPSQRQAMSQSALAAARRLTWQAAAHQLLGVIAAQPGGRQ